MAFLCRNSYGTCLFMFHFMNVVYSFVNYEIFRELHDRIQFEVDCAKSHHCVISEGMCKGMHGT